MNIFCSRILDKKDHFFSKSAVLNNNCELIVLIFSYFKGNKNAAFAVFGFEKYMFYNKVLCSGLILLILWYVYFFPLKCSHGSRERLNARNPSDVRALMSIIVACRTKILNILERPQIKKNREGKQNEENRFSNRGKMRKNFGVKSTKGNWLISFGCIFFWLWKYTFIIFERNKSQQVPRII